MCSSAVLKCCKCIRIHKGGEMCCLLRHVLLRSVAFRSITSRGHFPSFSPESSIFHLRAAGPRHRGPGFDFKIHWKQLAPSLPSSILWRSPAPPTPQTPQTPGPKPALQPDPEGLQVRGGGVTSQSCGHQPSTPLRSTHGLKTPSEDLQHDQRNQELNDGIRDRKWRHYCEKLRAPTGDLTCINIYIYVCLIIEECSEVLLWKHISARWKKIKETCLCWEYFLTHIKSKFWDGSFNSELKKNKVIAF